METSLLATQSHHHTQKRLFKKTTILAGITGLLIFYSLTGCATWKSTSSKQSVTQTAPVASATTAAPTATSPGSPWKLLWSDEFDGPAGTPPDPSKWTAAVGGGGWGNQQLEYDTANQNAYQDGQGDLILEARRGNPAGYRCWYGSCQYTSARISTENHFSFTYGLIEARIKIPYGQGIWSAFWLLGANFATVGWPACGEVDIMENISQDPAIVYGTVHGPHDSGYSSGTYQLKHGKFADGFHVFALQWDPNHLYFMVDGITYHTVNRSDFRDPADWVYDHPFSVILSLPIGGIWPGSPTSATTFPQKMYISYVRTYTHI